MKNKNCYFQAIRGFACLSVILIHILYKNDNTLNDLITIIIRKTINPCVGIFIFLSGYFFNFGDNLKKTYKYKILRIVCPLVIWNFIYTLYFFIIDNYSIKEFIKYFIYSAKGYHLYYLYVLIQLFLIFPFFIKYFKKHYNEKFLLLPLIISPFLNLILTILSFKYENIINIYKYTLFPWFSFFYLGYILKNNRSFIKKSKIEWITLIMYLFCLIEGIVIYFKFHKFNVAVSQLTFLSTIFSINLCMLLYKYRYLSVKNNNPFVIIGNYSYGIYLSHLLFIIILKNFLNDFFNNYIFFIVIMFFLISIFSTIINCIYYRIKKEIIIKRSLKYE